MLKINIYKTPERPLISSLNINTGNIKIITFYNYVLPPSVFFQLFKQNSCEFDLGCFPLIFIRKVLIV